MSNQLTSGQELPIPPSDVAETVVSDKVTDTDSVLADGKPKEGLQPSSDGVENVVFGLVTGIANVLGGNSNNGHQQRLADFEEMTAAERGKNQRQQVEVLTNMANSKKSAITSEMDKFDLMLQNQNERKMQMAEAGRNREERINKDFQDQLTDLESRQSKERKDFNEFINTVDQQDRAAFRDASILWAERTDQAEREAQQTVKELGEQVMNLNELRNKEQMEMAERFREQRNKNAAEALEFVGKRQKAILAGEQDEQEHKMVMTGLKAWGDSSRANVIKSFSSDNKEREMARTVQRVKRIESELDSEMEWIRNLKFVLLDVDQQAKDIKIHAGKCACKKLKDQLVHLRDDLQTIQSDEEGFGETRKDQADKILESIMNFHTSLSNLELILGNYPLYKDHLKEMQISASNDYDAMIGLCRGMASIQLENRTQTALTNNINTSFQEKTKLATSRQSQIQ